METLTRPGEHAPTNPPAVAFSSVMGICGLGLSWRAAGQVLAAPRAIGEWLIAVGVMLFIALSALYGIKTVRDPSIVVAEFRDPRSASNFACITVAVVIVAAAILPHAPSAALFLWALGTGSQLVLFLTLLGRWIAEPTKILHATPAWLVPIVGNVTATLPGVPLGFHETSWFLLAVGLISWIAFLPLLLHRLIFCEDKLPERLAPGLAIFVASPAVGCLSWLQLTGRVDAVYRFILVHGPVFRPACAALVAACGASTSCIGRLVGLHLSQCGARFCSDSLLPACSRNWRETSGVGQSRLDHNCRNRRGSHFIEKLLVEIVAFGPEPA
jgi:tellurite resistance protein